MSGLTKNAFYNIMFKDTPHIYGAKFTRSIGTNLYFEVDGNIFYLTIRNGKYKFQGELVNVVPFNESRDSERLKEQKFDIDYNTRLEEFESLGERGSTLTSSSGNSSSGNESSGGKSRRKRKTKCRNKKLTKTKSKRKKYY